MSRKNKYIAPVRMGARHYLLGCVLAVLFFGLVAVAKWRWIGIVSIRNGRFLVARYPLVEEKWDHPRLQLLRQREHLDQVVAPGKTQFEKIVLLRKWAHDQWRGGESGFYYPAWDVVEILDLARRHHNYGFCAQYAVVFLQACVAMGLHARYVDMGHFIIAVWSDEYDKWVIMDPTNDCHYERNGIPLGGMQLSRLSTGFVHDLYSVASGGTRTLVNKGDLEMFKRYTILLRNNQLSVPEIMSVNGKIEKLERLADYHLYPIVGRDHIGYGDQLLSWRPETAGSLKADKSISSDRDDFRHVFNQTMVFVASKDAEHGIAKLKLLAEQAPGFQTFQLQKPRGEWVDTRSEIMWNLAPGINAVAVRVKTQFGWVGPSSEVKIFYKTNWF